MMHTRAIAAIVFARLRAERRAIAFTAATGAIAGFIAPHGVEAHTAPAAANMALRSLWIAGPMLLCSALGVMSALLQGAGRAPDLDVCELSAPIFGRELARAKALTPCSIALLAACMFWIAQALRGFAAPPSYFALAIVTVIATTLIALSATVRDGISRWLYVGIAAALALLCYATVVYFNALLVALLLAVGAGFVALRQYGEALVRFDPL